MLGKQLKMGFQRTSVSPAWAAMLDQKQEYLESLWYRVLFALSSLFMALPCSLVTHLYFPTNCTNPSR